MQEKKQSLSTTYRDCTTLKDQIKCRHILVGDHTYYAGYYHDKSFDDCVMYLDEFDNKLDPNNIDRLISVNFAPFLPE